MKKIAIILIGMIFVFGPSLAQSDNRLDSLITLCEQQTVDSLKVDYYNEVASYCTNFDLEKVDIYSDSALSLAKNIGYKKGQIRANFNKGNLNYIKGDYPKTLKYYLDALQLLEEVGDKKGMANALMGIGNVHAAQKNLDEAIVYQNKALEIRKEIDDKMGQAYSYNNLGGIYLDKKEYMKALEHHLSSMKIKESLGEWRGLSSSYGNIGHIYQIMGNYTLALDYQKKALDIRTKLNNKKGMSIGYTDIGNIYLAQNEYTKAIEYQKKALVLAKEVGYGVGELNSLQSLSNSYEKIGEYQQALEYYKQQSILNDSIFNVERISEISKMEKKFEVEKTQKELQIVKKDKEIQELVVKEQAHKLRKQQMYGVVVGMFFLLSLGVAYSWYKRYQLKNKANRLLSEKNEFITHQNETINNRNKQITDSIEYAKTLQEAILPSGAILKRNFKDHFIYFKPRDIVSGDFYWFHEDKENIFIAVIDCTGHGVPGAFVSMLANNLLNEIVVEKKESTPSLVLAKMNKSVGSVFARNETNENPNDGMDISFAVINKTSKVIKFSGAKNKMLVIRGEEVIELQATEFSISGSTSDEVKFIEEELQLLENDSLYLFTDGYKDQFGGEEGKKLKYKHFLNLIKELKTSDLKDQEKQLDQFLTNWKGEFDQVDDICVVGILV